MSFNQHQQNVVECQTHALVLACPGSGKTLTLAKKAEYQLKIDVKAKVTIATFTRDSAVDIRKRIISVVGKHAAQRVDSGTFHALAMEQLKQGGYRFTIINENYAKQYIKRAMEACGFNDMELKTATEFIEQCKSNPDFVPANDDLGKLFLNYEKLLERDNCHRLSGNYF
jgi:superfamily I DNA/RNA helicase